LRLRHPKLDKKLRLRPAQAESAARIAPFCAVLSTFAAVRSCINPFSPVLVQEYDRYTPDDFAVWEKLFERQNNLIGERICSEYRHALDLVEFSADSVPRMERIRKHHSG
jgi:phenylalanine-4-hydroxylase